MNGSFLGRTLIVKKEHNEQQSQIERDAISIQLLL